MNDKYCTPITTEATMENGVKVEYDPNRGSYPEGTSPGMGKVYAKNDANLTKGFGTTVQNPESAVP